jgi:hypothetical protein
VAPSERPPGEFCAIAGIRAAMDAFAASGALPVRAPPARPGGGHAPFAFSTVNWFCMALVRMVAQDGCLAAQNGGFRPGQSAQRPRPPWASKRAAGAAEASAILELDATVAKMVAARASELGDTPARL